MLRLWTTAQRKKHNIIIKLKTQDYFRPHMLKVSVFGAQCSETQRLDYAYNVYPLDSGSAINTVFITWLNKKTINTTIKLNNVTMNNFKSHCQIDLIMSRVQFNGIRCLLDHCCLDRTTTGQ